MPGQQIQKGTTYVNYPTPGANQVTAENLNDHVDNAILLPGAISAQLEDTPQENDYLLAERTGTLFRYTIQSIKDLFASIFVPLSGGTMTGPLVLVNSTPSTAATAASKGYVDATAAATVLSGQIVMWGTSTVPSGWLECNGQSTAGYPNLIALFGTNLPDLRGEFVRGWDNGRGVDSGRVIQSAQAQDVQPHTHSYTVTSSVTSGSQGGNIGGLIPSSSSSTTGSTGTTETRPRNVALMFIVKT
jgi:microcystin-dependent protein